MEHDVSALLYLGPMLLPSFLLLVCMLQGWTLPRRQSQLYENWGKIVWSDLATATFKRKGDGGDVPEKEWRTKELVNSALEAWSILSALFGESGGVVMDNSWVSLAAKKVVTTVTNWSLSIHDWTSCCWAFCRAFSSSLSWSYCVSAKYMG